MPELTFRIEDVSAMRYAAVPTIDARLRIANANSSQPIHSILLNCQARIEPLGRTYTAEEEARLLELFGERERWARTMKPMFWTQVVLSIPGFTGITEADLPLPCTLDFDVAATKYFYGLHAGDVQVAVLFSGTVFYANSEGALQAAQIPWDRETRFHLSAATWHAAVEMHYPNSNWLRVRRDLFDRIYRYKVAHGHALWEQAVEQLIERAEQNAEPQPAGEGTP